MATQKVLRLTKRNGGIESIQEFQEPIPQPGDLEVLVRVRGVSLNFRDVAIPTGRYPLPTKDNVVLTSDLAGTVAQIGSKVKGFSIDEKVLSPLNLGFLYGDCEDITLALGGEIDGGLQEYIVLPAHILIKIPPESNLSFVQWATLVGTGSTIWNSFYGNVHLKPGDVVLAQGTGGTSLTGIVFAKAAGAKVIITSSSDEKLEFARKLGADYTINYKTHPNWAAEVLRITNGKGANHILDVGGASTIGQSVEAVANGGIISVIGFLTGEPPEGNPNLIVPLITKSAILRGIFGGSKQQLEEAVRFVASYNLDLYVDKTFEFGREGVVEGLKFVDAGKQVGKVGISFP